MRILEHRLDLQEKELRIKELERDHEQQMFKPKKQMKPKISTDTEGHNKHGFLIGFDKSQNCWTVKYYPNIIKTGGHKSIT